MWRVGRCRINPATPRYLLLKSVPNDKTPTQWPKAVHPAHAGPSPDPDNGAGHPEQRQHEHVAGIPDSGLNHPSAGENSLSILNKSYILEEQVRGAMEIALFIQNIQEERAEVALYIFINQVGRDISNSSPRSP